MLTLPHGRVSVCGSEPHSEQGHRFAGADGTSPPKWMVESTLYILMLAPTGRSIANTMAAPCVFSEKCVLPSCATGNSRAPNGAIWTSNASLHTGISSELAGVLPGFEYRLPEE